MSGDKTSLLTEVQHGEPLQTGNTSINNGDVKQDNIAALSIPKMASIGQAPHSNVSKHATVISTHEPSTSLIPSSDANKHGNSIATHDSAKSSTTEVLTSNQDFNSADTNKQATNQSTLTTSTYLQTNDNDKENPLPPVIPSTSQIPNTIKQAIAIAANDTPKSSTIMAPASNQDTNSIDQTSLLRGNGDTKHATNQSIQTTFNDLQTNNDGHVNPLPTASTSQIPYSNANKLANMIAALDSPKSSTIIDKDSNTINPTSSLNANNDTKHAINQSIQTTSNDLQTNKDGYVNPLPTASISQIPDSDANKQANTIAARDSPKSSTIIDQDSNIINPTSSLKADNGTKKATNQSVETTSTNLQTDKESPPNVMTSIEERKHLVNLIGQELRFIKQICPKLGKHEKVIKNEAQKVSEAYEKLRDEPCELKELKDLKKSVTKLKLQIPAKYRTYDESDKKKNQQSHVETKDISSKLQKQMPRLHNKLFHKSPLCRAIQLRFNELRGELKLCLLCFSVFPKNAIISRRAMVYWWIGEGFIPREDDLESGRSVEDCANDFFNELMDKEFIEPDSKSDGRYVANCKMHPVVRAALVMIADELNFFDFDRYGDPKDFGKFDEIESPEDLPRFHPLGDPREFFDFFDESRKSTLETIEFIDSKGNPNQFAALEYDPPVVDRDGKPIDSDKKPVDRDGKPIDSSKKHYFYRRKRITTKSFKVCLMGSGLSKGISWEKLHMLFNVKENILEFKPEWFLRMKNINILFLGRWQSSAAHHIEVDDFDFEKSLDYMDHVRFFSLQGVSRVSKLPDSISKLKTLLILDLRACHNLEVIPKTIGSLKFLTHLDISECYLLKEIPKDVSFLESLQVLKGFVVVESPGRDVCTLQDLRKLGNLRKLSMYTHMNEFPQDFHLDALQKLETLRKLTILWGGHESTPKTVVSKQDVNKKQNIASKFMRLKSKKKGVEGSIRRMNAFISNSTLGETLEKLDLKCFPRRETPDWLTAGSLKGLKKLYIRGGSFSDLGQYQDTHRWDDSSVASKETWNVGILRLKYLEELNMEWRELQNLFPKLTSLEKVKCPRLSLFPCNEHGVWIKKASRTI